MVILFSAAISKKHQDALKEKYPNQTFLFCENMSEAQDKLSEATILVTYGEDLNESLIEQAAKLQWIMVISAGMDQMPFEAIAKRGILVTNSRGISKIPMAEYAISMFMQVYRQAPQLYENQKISKWDRSVRMLEITGKTMVVLGTGAIGQETARLAKAFHMTTYGVSRSGRPVEYFDETYKTAELEKVLSKADFIVAVLPSTEETQYLLTEAHFKQMKNDAVFLNMGRGDLVKSEVILQAVREDQIAHAVLDVFEEEPLPEDHALWNEEKVTVTPHLSGISPHYQTRALDIFTNNLDTYLADKEEGYINKIDVSRGY
ncbi:Phosphoglycerate dehydrogenase [Oceanobacillus limi]|uniref:Phosphoglycerate dehydrogenase n=1 Tax=Oceanobacillus limi TaxID=930131 RepID=A0A1I0GIA1_9BACI|nr:D-2-hydroxyacid dehydrogenase [Oceanobacillus limi]SET70757.1 Phosphoglycerate dehydrogenase [Oceanobacillus limi]